MTSELCVPHPPIAIAADEDLTLGMLPTGQPIYRPGSGVTSGDGTPASPFVIEGLCIVNDMMGTRAISIRGTSAHIVVRDVDVGNASRVIEVEDAAHLTLEDISGARDVFLRSVEDVVIARSNLSRVEGYDLADVRIENVTFWRGTYDYAADFARAQRLEIRNSLFYSAPNSITIRESWDSIVEGTSVFGAAKPIRLIGGGRNVLEGNLVEGPSEALVIAGTGQILRNNTVIRSGIDLWGTETVMDGNAMVSGGLRFALKDLPTRLQRIGAGNSEDGLPIRYIRDASGGVVEAGSGRVIIASSSGVTVRDRTGPVEISYSSSMTVTRSSGPVSLLWSSNVVVRENSFVGAGVAIEASSSNVVERNSFTGGATCVAVYGSPSNVFVDNRFESCAKGLRIENARLNVVEHNHFANATDMGIESYSTGLGNDWTFVGNNTFTGNWIGLRVYVTPIIVERNNFQGNAVGARMDSVAWLDAPTNWWGCSAGPGSPGCDSALGPIDFAPFAASPIPTAGPR